MESWWRKVNTVMKDEKDHELITKNSAQDIKAFWYYLFPGVSPLHMHTSMFTFSLKLLGNEEQQAKYLPLADHLNIIGCYA